jgi:hypothetical protein
MNEARLNAFLGKAINDLGAAVSVCWCRLATRSASTVPWRRHA